MHYAGSTSDRMEFWNCAKYCGSRIKFATMRTTKLFLPQIIDATEKPTLFQALLPPELRLALRVGHRRDADAHGRANASQSLDLLHLPFSPLEQDCTGYRHCTLGNRDGKENSVGTHMQRNGQPVR